MDFSAVVNEEQVKTIRPPATPILDLDVAKRDLSPYREQIANMVASAMALTVDCEETNAMAVELGTQAKKLNRMIEAQKKQITEIPNDFVKAVRNFCKAFQDDLIRIEKITKKKVNIYQNKLELEQRKAEEKARKATQELQRKINKEAEKAGVEAPKIETPIMPEPPKVTRTDSGSSYIRKEWTFEIINPKSIPREYMKVDEQAIRKAVKAGVREISGVRIYQETNTVYRN